MHITCNVNQTEAIRRGFNTSSTVKLDVDVTTLTEQQRQIFAEFFSDGFLKRRNPLGADWCPALPQPDVAGFVEALETIAGPILDREKQRQAEAQAKEDARLADAKAEDERWFATPDADLIQYETAGVLRKRHPSFVLDVDGDCCYSCYATNPPEPVFLSYLPEDTRLALKPELGGGLRKERQLRLVSLARQHNLPFYHAGVLARQERKAQREAEEKLAEARHAEHAQAAREIIQQLGSPEQKARLERGLMADPLKEATALATDEAFRNVPLDVATPPTEDDVDLSKWEENGGDLSYDLPGVKRGSSKASSFDNEEMLAYLVAEKLILYHVPGAKVEPWVLSITRDHEDIPWHAKPVVRVSATARGLTVTRDFDLP